MKAISSLKNYKYPFIFCLLLLVAAVSEAQVYIQTLPSTPSDGSMQIYGAGGIINKISYAHIKGSPFWNDDWRLATLYGSTSSDRWLKKIKLNLVTGQIHYQDKDSNELVINEGLVSKIVFHKGDDVNTSDAVFLYTSDDIILNRGKTSAFIQSLNEGNYQLLKFIKRSFATGDSLFGTLKRYYFTNNVKYYFLAGRKVQPLKKLNEDNILFFVPNSSSYREWISQNKIDFRKEGGVIQFLNYYNTGKQ